QNDKQLSDTRLVMITSQGRQGDAKRMQEIGFAGYLCKPIRQSELFNVLQQVAGIDSKDKDRRLITRYTSREQQQKQFAGRVLVVEDNTTNQQVAQGMLEKFGLYVDVAANGHEAIQALEKLSYDIVFMDCQMPIMDGYTATKRIRTQPSLTRVQSVPVIGLTANAMRGDRDICLAAGMDDYISKPVDPNRLRQALVRWLPNYQYQNKTQAEPSQTDETKPDDHTDTDDDTSEKQTAIKLVFDHAALYSRLMDDEALIRTVAESFIIDMSKQIELLKSSVDASDIDKAITQAHKIKGGSANMGGMALSAVALQIELAGKAGDLTALREGSERIAQDFEQLKLAIEEKLF
nr:response regulator [Betaproteobacteria bacterium]